MVRPSIEVATSVLQAQDGSFVGTYLDGAGNEYMLGHDVSGTVNWIVPNFVPQIATAEGGAIENQIPNTCIR